MPFLSQSYAAILGVIVIIIIGIVVEKRKVVWENVFGNVLSFILVFATVDMSYALAVGFVSYLILGIIVAYYKIKTFYFMFGFKTYGALSFVLLLAANNVLGLSIISTSFENLYKFIVIWIVAAVLIHIIAYIYDR